MIVGYLTKRTVVLPPVEGWYLIDWGKRARMNSGDTRGKSGYPDFFDFDDLELEVSTISTRQFVSEMKDTLGIDAKFAVDDYFDGGMKEWRKYLNQMADEKDTNMGWGPLAHILNWPSIEAVERSDHKPDRMFISNRDNVGLYAHTLIGEECDGDFDGDLSLSLFLVCGVTTEYTERQQGLDWIHFPSCDKGDPGTSRDFRYLGQVASFVWFEDTEQDNDLKRMLRDHVHLRGEIMEYASLIVQKLGAFQYAALHIRRNELQYKNSFIAAGDVAVAQTVTTSTTTTSSSTTT